MIAVSRDRDPAVTFVRGAILMGLAAFDEARRAGRRRGDKTADKVAEGRVPRGEPARAACRPRYHRE